MTASSDAPMRTARVLVGVFVLIAASACHSSAPVTRRFAQPPIESYAVSTMPVQLDGRVESVAVAAVSADFFAAAQVRPLVGRLFVADDHRTQASKVVVLGHELWQRRFHSAAGVIGTTLTVNDQPFTIVGVAEPGFALPQGAQLWMPRTDR